MTLSGGREPSDREREAERSDDLRLLDPSLPVPSKLGFVRAIGERLQRRAEQGGPGWNRVRELFEAGEARQEELALERERLIAGETDQDRIAEAIRRQEASGSADLGAGARARTEARVRQTIARKHGDLYHGATEERIEREDRRNAAIDDDAREVLARQDVLDELEQEDAERRRRPHDEARQEIEQAEAAARPRRVGLVDALLAELEQADQPGAREALRAALLREQEDDNR